jgi:transcription elongation factor SPT5
VARGYDSLGGYKLYDVVQLGNQSAVVVHVGTSTLRVLTHLGDVQEVEPVKLKGKKSDAKAGPGGGAAMDKAGAEILVNDPVTIVHGAPLRGAGGGGANMLPRPGPLSGLEATVKHVHRSLLFVHCRQRPDNAGMLVVKAHDVKLSGNVVSGVGRKGGAMQRAASSATAGHAKRRTDELINKTVRIRKGSYKGLIGIAVMANDDEAQVELHARCAAAGLRAPRG